MYYSKFCNSCPNLVKTESNISPHAYDVTCGIVSYEAFGVSRHRRIDTNVKLSEDIETPSWCPSNKKKETTTTTPTYMSYSDKREKMKTFKRKIEWDDIKEGEVYVIPKILNQARKIVRVITKNDLSCICHEINENTLNEYSYNVTFYPSDLDAIFLNTIHNF